ncbi:MAG: OmpA family protein [Hyphomicrobiaceae bacterium]
MRDRGRIYVRHDDRARLGRQYRDVRVIESPRGRVRTVFNAGPRRVVAVRDPGGRLLYKYRYAPGGRRVVLIDNRPLYAVGAAIIFAGALAAIAAPRITIPRERYIVDYRLASYDDVYDTLRAPPVSRIERRYSLDEVLHRRNVRDYVRRIDLDEITFASGSWDLEPSQFARLDRIARAMKAVLDSDPDQVFLIEGHTDAVGSDEDNLSLSDRRAETIAEILTEEYGIPPENLVTQGYGESDLKIDTELPERLNRRVAVRNITALLARGDVDQDDYDDDRRTR